MPCQEGKRLERVFGQIQQRTGGTEEDFELKRSVDESIDDLEQDGFQNSKQPKK